MYKSKIYFLLFFWLINSQANEDGLSQVTKLAVEAEALLFDALVRTYPNLNDEVVSRIRDRLSSSIKEYNEEYFLETQNLIFSEVGEEGYKFAEPLENYLVRNSEYGLHVFRTFLHRLISNSGHSQFLSILVPGCGIFYESDTIVNLLKPEKVLAIDIRQEDIEISRKIQKNSIVSYLNADLEQKIKDTSLYDLVLFLHPGVIDYNKKDAGNHDTSLGDYINEEFALIISNTLMRLKLNGYAMFVLYGIEEMEVLNAWLSRDSSLDIQARIINRGLIFTDFAIFLLACNDQACINKAQKEVFGVYRAALIVQKLSGQ